MLSIYLDFGTGQKGPLLSEASIGLLFIFRPPNVLFNVLHGNSTVQYDNKSAARARITFSSDKDSGVTLVLRPEDAAF